VVVSCDHRPMTDRLHPKTQAIIDKIFKRLEDLKKAKTFDELAELCQTSQENMVRIFNKRRGQNPERFTLNMALKIWTGLGNQPETLIADCSLDPLLVAKIRKIQASEYREVFDLMVEVLKDYEYANPGQLALIKAALETVKAAIIDQKNLQPGNPGELSLTTAEGEK